MFNSRGFFAHIAASVMAGLSLTMPNIPTAAQPQRVQPAAPVRRKRGIRIINGTSVRQLRRAINSGWTPPEGILTRKALQRHAWCRKQVAAAFLRKKVGQSLPGDEALLAA